MNNQLTYFRYLLDKCKTHENLVKQIHARTITLGSLSTNQQFACKLLNTYTKLNKPIESQKIFTQIKNPDLVSWTCLISMYLQIGSPTKAFSLFSDMVGSTSLRPDGFSVVGALSACGRNKDMKNGKIVHGMVVRFELGSDPIVGNALIDMYSRIGEIGYAKTVFDVMEVKDVVSWSSLLNGFVMCDGIENARTVFDEMPLRNAVSWTVMIVGYVRGKAAVLGLELFREMRAEGRAHPTEITIVTVLSGCADIGALDFGRTVHGYVNKFVMVVDVAVNNALIDMYCKSGSLDLGLKIFCQMTGKDLFSRTTMISGLALHGKGIDAVKLFDDMLESGLVPNEVTFVSVLSACGHAGLIYEGKILFNRLIHSYGFKPTVRHYGCMVDLLGRGGCLDEAVELIECMPMKPDAVIWRSLLSACLWKGDLKLGEMAARKVLELEPDDDGVYILLWNIYCNANQWEDALKTMKMMRNQKIKKKRGSSWIELNGIVHEFLAEDLIHHISPDIYMVLETIIRQSKLNDSPLFLDRCKFFVPK